MATINAATPTDQIHPWVAQGSRAVRFGIVGGPRGEWAELRDFVQMAEDLGFDSYCAPTIH